MENDLLTFAKESANTPDASNPWQVLIVDDDTDIHTVTKLALDGVCIQGRALAFTSAFSGSQAKEILRDNQNFALIFLDVVMENDLAGLDVVTYIRKELLNDRVRIIIRTGEPGSAPEREIVDNYDINDYKEKTELNVTRLYTSVRSSLIQYDQISALYDHQKNLESSIDAKVKEIQLQQDALIQSSRQTQMSDFLNMISHQWRQPLSRIGAVIAQMKIGHSLGNLTFDEVDEMLDSAEEHVQYLSNILRNFQNLYLQKEHSEYVAADLILQNSLRLLEKVLADKSISVNIDTTKIAVMPKICSEIGQVFINIIKNAYDAIVRQQQNLGEINIRFHFQNDDLIIEIEDNAGLVEGKELGPKIFEPYVSTAPEKHEKGLGLYVCKMIVEKHCGGSISVKKGKSGACFSLFLPKDNGSCN